MDKTNLPHPAQATPEASTPTISSHEQTLKKPAPVQVPVHEGLVVQHPATHARYQAPTVSTSRWALLRAHRQQWPNQMDRTAKEHHL